MWNYKHRDFFKLSIQIPEDLMQQLAREKTPAGK
jgi:hypothetical protein